MRLILRFALACLLVLALPLQTLAAWVQPACTGMAGVAWSPAARDMQADAPVAMALPSAMNAGAECPDHPAASGDATRLHHPEAGSACEDGSPCGHCTLSAPAPALLPASTAVPPATGGPVRWPAPLLTPEPPWPQGLERPPRVDGA